MDYGSPGGSWQKKKHKVHPICFVGVAWLGTLLSFCRSVLTRSGRVPTRSSCAAGSLAKCHVAIRVTEHCTGQVPLERPFSREHRSAYREMKEKERY